MMDSPLRPVCRASRPAHGRFLRLGPGLLALALVAVACRDELTAPGDCPALCPGGQPTVLDTVITADPGQDSAYVGYVKPGLGVSLRVSDSLPASDDRALIQFLPLPDSILVRDTLRTYTVDSLSISFFLQARDTAVHNLRVLLYRLPPTLDTTTTFADVAPSLIPANLFDSIMVSDTLRAGGLRVLYTGASLSKVAVPPGDSGRIALGLAIAADGPTGIRVGSIASGTSPVVISYVHAAIADTGLQKQVIVRGPQFTGFVSRNPPVLDPDFLTVGGAPTARSIIRFTLPPSLRDSASLLRATLELVPASPLLGLPGDTTALEVRNVLIDLGAKSPLLISTGRIGRTLLQQGSADTVKVEILPLVQLWQSSDSLPQAVMLQVTPVASSFMRPVFESTRSGGPAPRLRISYLVDFPFERP